MQMIITNPSPYCYISGVLNTLLLTSCCIFATAVNSANFNIVRDVSRTAVSIATLTGCVPQLSKQKIDTILKPLQDIFHYVMLLFKLH
mmetsp:Transcript_29508/g.48417  ORF Transcript_29508/g.48417 Transcript_29508/m.48417 type:complete len:88 (-) Transcript_29508:729-992(-)